VVTLLKGKQQISIATIVLQETEKKSLHNSAVYERNAEMLEKH